ncbi:MAG: class I SAM-dependent methyltransferase, partial [FCB group bacterium]|nr:class I SAM-dependent methyltransferase [FCB group bacterium]
MSNDKEIIQHQIEYYRARAAEYDQWVNREFRYDRGEEQKIRWMAARKDMEKALADSIPSGDILELACGTGFWTVHLIPYATKLTAVDVSPEMIEINRHKFNDLRIEYIEADLFSWRPSCQYDFIFFSFWLSHIPASHFDSFWEMVRGALKPGGRAFFIDSLMTQESTAINHAQLEKDGKAKRKLNDGSEYEIV